MLKKLIRYFFPKKNPFQGDPNIVKAFTVDGVDFYTFEDFMQVGYQRGLALLEFKEELDSGLDKKFYETMVQSAITFLGQGKTDKVLEILQSFEDALKCSAYTK